MVKKKETTTTRQKLDAYVNSMSGVGTSKDKTIYGYFSPIRLGLGDIENTFNASAIMKKIIKIIPLYVMKEGYKILTDSTSVKEQDIAEELRRLKFDTILFKAGIYSRMYGGAGILLGVQDGKDVSEPVDMRAIRKITFLKHLSAWRLWPDLASINADPNSPHFDLPEYYYMLPAGYATFAPSEINSYTRVHADRVIRLQGEETGEYAKIKYRFWGQSVIEMMYNAVSKYEQSEDAGASIVHDFNTFVYKIKDFMSLVAAGTEDLLRARLEVVDTAKGMLNALVMDDTESVDTLSRHVSGLPEIMGRVRERIAVECEIPHTLLFGESQSGLGASGDSELYHFYDNIRSEQNTKYTPAVERMVELICAQKEFKSRGKIPKITVMWNNLDDLNDKDRSEMYLRYAQADTHYYNLGLDGDTIIKQRFGGHRFSPDLHVSEDYVIEEEPSEDEVNDYKVSRARTQESTEESRPSESEELKSKPK